MLLAWKQAADSWVVFGDTFGQAISLGDQIYPHRCRAGAPHGVEPRIKSPEADQAA